MSANGVNASAVLRLYKREKLKPASIAETLDISVDQVYRTVRQAEHDAKKHDARRVAKREVDAARHAIEIARETLYSIGVSSYELHALNAAAECLALQAQGQELVKRARGKG